MNEPNRPMAKGRGSQIHPANRFEAVRYEDDFEQLAADDDYLDGRRSVRTQYISDDSKSIVSENNSPDIPFRYSVNPYRGCAHGCAYCYARPTHEYLGLNAGLDFESKIYVKERAPDLFRDWLARDSYEPEVVVFSGVTDCYQPAERHYRLTRRCLEVALEARQPIGIVTKNALVMRDVDILAEMARLGIVNVSLSVTTLDADLARTMEPRTSTPEARFRTLQLLRDAGIPAFVLVAPVIPGLNDHEIPAILKAAAEARACGASYTLLRLPLTVRGVFLEWLERTQPLRQARVESLVRSTRDGRLNDTQFGQRMKGTGALADEIQQVFKVFARQFGLDRRPAPLDVSQFRPPRASSGQMRLF